MTSALTKLLFYRKEVDCFDNSLQSSKRQKLESKEEEVKQ